MVAPRAGSDCPRSVLMSSIVSCSFSTDPPFPAPRMSATFARILPRYVGQVVGQMIHLSRETPASKAQHHEDQRDGREGQPGRGRSTARASRQEASAQT